MKRLLLLLLCLTVVGCASKSNIRYTAEEGKTYYTKTNIWYEKPARVETIYHKGIIIPIGTKVKVISHKGNIVKFALNSGVEITLINPVKHTQLKPEEFFNEYFSETDTLASGSAFSKLSGEEQEKVKKGILTLWMTKDAVLMSYGRPPARTTPSITSDIWFYWKSRFVKFEVVFENNKLVSMES